MPSGAGRVAVSTFPGERWAERAPADAGFDARALAEAMRTAHPAGAVIVVHDGRVIARAGNDSAANYTASVRKSVLSLLVGQAVARGELRLDATLAELGIDDRPPLLPRERTARVRDLLMARSGVFHPAANPGDALAYAPARGSQAPGTYFLYNNWDFNALGTILAQQAHASVYDLLERDLAVPLQFQDFSRSAQRLEGDTTRSMHLSYPMQLSARDLARIGLLALSRGTWNGRTIVPAAWVDSATATLTPSSAMHPESWRSEGQGYGYLWWTQEAESTSSWHGAFAAEGAGGQYLLVLPRLGMVIAHEVPESAQARVSWTEFTTLACRITNARAAGARQPRM